jgi:acyl carrier protein
MEIVDEVRSIIAKTLKVPLEQLTPETRLDEIGAESLDVIEIIFELEEKFGIDISVKADELGGKGKPKAGGAQVDASDFRTIGDIAAAVKKLVDAKASA